MDFRTSAISGVPLIGDGVCSRTLGKSLSFPNLRYFYSYSFLNFCAWYECTSMPLSLPGIRDVQCVPGRGGP